MATKAAAISPTRSTKSAYEEYVNPQRVSLLKLLGLNEEYERCQGTVLYTKGGRRILDFLSGYCVHNAGHNHPFIVRALKDELDRSGAAMLQSHVPAQAGELAERLCKLAGGGLKKAYWKQRQRRNRSSDQVCPRDYWPAGHGLRAELLSWANRRGLVADE